MLWPKGCLPTHPPLHPLTNEQRLPLPLLLAAGTAPCKQQQQPQARMQQRQRQGSRQQQHYSSSSSSSRGRQARKTPAASLCCTAPRRWRWRQPFALRAPRLHRPCGTRADPSLSSPQLLVRGAGAFTFSTRLQCLDESKNGRRAWPDALSVGRLFRAPQCVFDSRARAGLSLASSFACLFSPHVLQ